MLSLRSSANTSDGDGSSNTKSAIIAGAVVGSLCILGLGLMWCILWRRRNLQLRGDMEDRQRELATMHPQRSETIRATTEFQWPTRTSEGPNRMTHLHHAQTNPEKEVCLSSTTSIPKLSTPASVHQKPDYHISPKSFSSELYRHHEQQQHELKLKHSGLSIFQPELAELPPHEASELYHRQPQELPVPTPPPVAAHELEGHLSPETPGERNRFSYQR